MGTAAGPPTTSFTSAPAENAEPLLAPPTAAAEVKHQLHQQHQQRREWYALEEEEVWVRLALCREVMAVLQVQVQAAILARKINTDATTADLPVAALVHQLRATEGTDTHNAPVMAELSPIRLPT